MNQVKMLLLVSMVMLFTACGGSNGAYQDYEALSETEKIRQQAIMSNALESANYILAQEEENKDKLDAIFAEQRNKLVKSGVLIPN